MGSATSQSIIRALRKLFTMHGLPDFLVSDNGPQLMATMFARFLAKLGILHAFVTPFNPVANGLAERAVCTTKEVLGRMGTENWQEDIDKFLLRQHATPRPTTNMSPAELLMGRKIRTTLDRLYPDYTPERSLESSRQLRGFALDTAVYTRNCTSQPLWVRGRVINIACPCSYKIELDDGRV